MMDEQERPEANEAEMDEQEQRETAEAEKQYSEAGKQHTEAEKRYAEAEKQYTDTMEASKQAGAKRREEAEQRRAEEEAEQQANEAAKQFADAVRASYQAMSDRAISAQEHNAELMRKFFNGVINNLRTQTEDNRAMTQELADQQRRTQEAGQALAQESVGVYMDFVNSIFSFYQGSVQEEDAEAAERGTTETDTSTGGERVESQEAGGGLPIEDYDSLGVKKISERLEELSDEEVEQLRRYETANKNRSTLLVRFNERLGASST